MYKQIGSGLVLILVVAALGCSGSSDSPGAARTAATEPSSTPPASPGDSSAPGAHGTSSVGGSVKFEGSVPKLRPIKMNADPGCLKKHSSDVMPDVLVLGADNALANVFVRVTSGVGGSYPAPAEAAVLNQDGCRYVPHVAGVMVGQPFKVLNSDGLLHNVHSLSKINSSFNRAMPASVTEAEFSFTKKEDMFKIKCDVHPWMGAFVAVLDHPFFAVTGNDGAFEIAGLPAGSYEIEAWHERLGTQSVTVELADGQAETADFVFAK